MIGKIRSFQARNFRVLKNVNVVFNDHLQVLVGSNGSGKSTIFDAINFIFALFSEPLGKVVADRTRNFQDLVWNRSTKDMGFELAIELEFVSSLRFRYELAIGESSSGIDVVTEQAFLGNLETTAFKEYSDRESIITKDWTSFDLLPVFLSRLSSDQSYRSTFFYMNADTLDEEQERIRFYHDDSALRTAILIDGLNREDDKDSESGKNKVYSIGPIIKDISVLKSTDIQLLQLDGLELKKPCPMNGGKAMKLAQDGSNLPWLVDSFKKIDPNGFEDWVEHLRTVMVHLIDIDVKIREEDRHAYLLITYTNRVDVPSWGVSEGTLRLLALTLLAYLPYGHPIAYLIEEPENGIHPIAVEIVYQSLSSIYESQVFIASHSPIFLRCVDVNEVLCFSRQADGITITTGHHHPRLKEWKTTGDNDLFFATDLLT